MGKLARFDFPTNYAVKVEQANSPRHKDQGGEPEICIQVQVNFQADEPAEDLVPPTKKNKQYDDQGRPHEVHAEGPTALPIRPALSGAAKRA